MKVTASRHAVVLAIVLAATCGEAVSQEVGSREWFEKAREIAAKNDLPPDGTYFEFRQTYYADRSEAEYQALLSEIRGKPEHPKRQQVLELGRRLKSGGDSIQTRVWYFDPTHWRIATDTPFDDGHIPWTDAARRGSDGWRLIPQSLILLGMADPEPGYDIETSLISTRATWQYLSCANLGRLHGWATTSVNTAHDAWTAVLTSQDSQQEVTLHGVITETGELFITKRVNTLSVGRPQYQGGWAEFEPDDDGLLPVVIPGLKPARAVKRGYPTPGQSSSLWEAIAFRPADDTQRELLLSTPSPEKEDPLRSLDALTGVIDKTSGKMVPIHDGNLDHANAAALPESRQKRPGRWLQIVAAAVLGGVTFVLVLFRITKK